MTGGMTVKAYVVLERAVEDGFQYGWNRAHKHMDNPDREHIESEVVRAVLNSICDVFDFDDEPR